MTTPHARSESETVRKAWEDLTAAFLAGEWASYREFFVDASDFRMMHPDGREWLSGPDEFARVYQDRIRGTSGWDVETGRFEVSISPDGAVAWTAAEVSIDAGDWAQTAWQLAVWQKVGGRWRIASSMSANVPDQ